MPADPGADAALLATVDPPAPGAGGRRHVVVVADGDVPPRSELDAAWPGWDAEIVAVVAADGGLARAEAIGLRPTLLVGDLDSLPTEAVARVLEAGLPVVRASPDKDESDTELAALEAVRLGATRITILGAFGGGRLDHALANLALLAHPGLVGADVVELDGRSRAALVVAPGPDGGPVTRPLPGRPGGLVSLLPLDAEVAGITTRGLRYELHDEPLVLGPARGLSNVRTVPDAAVTVRIGRLLVVETADPADVPAPGGRVEPDATTGSTGRLSSGS